MNKKPLISHYLTTLLLALLFLFSCGVSAAAKDGKKYGDWIVSCQKSKADKKNRCGIMQEAKGKKGNVLAVMSIWKPPKQNNPVAMFTLPLGIYLPSGIGLKIDDGSVKRIPINRCSPKGCHTMIVLDRDLLETIKQGSNAKVGFSLTKKRNMTVTFSLTGVTVGIYSISAK